MKNLSVQGGQEKGEGVECASVKSHMFATAAGNQANTLRAAFHDSVAPLVFSWTSAIKPIEPQIWLLQLALLHLIASHLSASSSWMLRQ